MLVDDQQAALDVLLAPLEPVLVLERRELVEQLGQPGVAHGEERVARRDAERVRDPGLAGAARAGDQDVPAVANPAAVRQLEDEGPVEPAAAVVADDVDVRVGLGEPGLAQQAHALVGPPRIPFRVDDRREPLVEARLGDTGRVLLLPVRPGHRLQPHLVHLAHGRFVRRCSSSSPGSSSLSKLS